MPCPINRIITSGRMAKAADNLGTAKEAHPQQLGTLAHVQAAIRFLAPLLNVEKRCHSSGAMQRSRCHLQVIEVKPEHLQGPAARLLLPAYLGISHSYQMGIDHLIRAHAKATGPSVHLKCSSELLAARQLASMFLPNTLQSQDTLHLLRLLHG